MPKIKHVIKCRKCGYVYDVKICDISDSKSVMEKIITTTGVWMLTGQSCPECKSPIKLDWEPTIEIDVEQI